MLADNCSPESNAESKIDKIEENIYQTFRPHRLAPDIVHIDALYIAKFPEHVFRVVSFEVHAALGHDASQMSSDNWPSISSYEVVFRFVLPLHFSVMIY